MLRRAGNTSSSNPGTGGGASNSGGLSGRITPMGRRHGGSNNNPFGSGGGRSGRFHPMLYVIGMVVIMMCVSWIYFPDEVLILEKEAEQVGQEWAQKAIHAEHDMEDWLHQSDTSTGSASTSGNQKKDQAASEAATARMMAQSSKWVDGEKALKRKLTELAEKQQKGELLGVPVLTRWLGDDYPAWVTPDMDEAKWRSDVAEKYKQMRQEEEEWKKQMQQIIDQKEGGELGITSPKR